MQDINLTEIMDAFVSLFTDVFIKVLNIFLNFFDNNSLIARVILALTTSEGIITVVFLLILFIPIIIQLKRSNKNNQSNEGML